MLLVDSVDAGKQSYEVSAVDPARMSRSGRDASSRSLAHQAGLETLLEGGKMAACCRQDAPQVFDELRPRLARRRRRRGRNRTQLAPDVRLRLAQAAPQAVAAGHRQGTPCHAQPSSVAAQASHNGADEVEQRLGAHDEARQDALQQYRESQAATLTARTVRAEQASTPNDDLLTPLAVAAKKAVPNERSNAAAMGARGELGPA